VPYRARRCAQRLLADRFRSSGVVVPSCVRRAGKVKHWRSRPRNGSDAATSAVRRRKRGAGFVVGFFYGIAAPAKVQPDVGARVGEAIREITELPMSARACDAGMSVDFRDKRAISRPDAKEYRKSHGGSRSWHSTGVNRSVIDDTPDPRTRQNRGDRFCRHSSTVGKRRLGPSCLARISSAACHAGFSALQRCRHGNCHSGGTVPAGARSPAKRGSRASPPIGDPSFQSSGLTALLSRPISALDRIDYLDHAVVLMDANACGLHDHAGGNSPYLRGAPFATGQSVRGASRS